MEKLLISACLLGNKCRYDGKDNALDILDELKEKYELIPVCPEVDGGLPTPRYPSEIRGDKVINSQNEDNTAYFLKGAKKAIALVKKYHIRYALLKAKSPSCGKDYIYDGSFNHVLTSGNGILVRELLKLGVTIYNEQDVRRLLS